MDPCKVYHLQQWAATNYRAACLILLPMAGNSRAARIRQLCMAGWELLRGWVCLIDCTLRCLWWGCWLQKRGVRVGLLCSC
jgi:hypothetical protein